MDTNKTKILHIQGNEITIGFPVEEVYADLLNGEFNENHVETLIMNAWVVLRRGILVRQYQATISFNYVHFTDKGHLPCGEYDIEVYYDSQDQGHHMRLKYEKMLIVVDSTEAGQIYQSSDYDVMAYYPVIRGRKSAIVIEGNKIYLEVGGRFGEDDDPDDGKAMISTGYGDGYIERENGKIILYI